MGVRNASAILFGSQPAAQQDALVPSTISVPKQPESPVYSVDRWNDVIDQAAVQYPSVPKEIVRSIIDQESSGNPFAIGPDTNYGKAKGLGQFVDDTARRYVPGWQSPQDSFDPTKNIYGIFNYMADLIRQEGSLEGALERYYGRGKHDVGPTTGGYVSEVMGRAGVPLGQQVAGRQAPKMANLMETLGILNLAPEKPMARDTMTPTARPVFGEEPQAVPAPAAAPTVQPQTFGPPVPETLAAAIPSVTPAAVRPVPAVQSTLMAPPAGAVSPYAVPKVPGAPTAAPSAIPSEFSGATDAIASLPKDKQASVVEALQSLEIGASPQKLQDVSMQLALQMKDVPPNQKDFFISSLPPYLRDLTAESYRTAERQGAMGGIGAVGRLGANLVATGQKAVVGAIKGGVDIGLNLAGYKGVKWTPTKFNGQPDPFLDNIMAAANVMDNPDVKRGEVLNAIQKTKEAPKSWFGKIGQQLELGRYDLVIPQMVADAAVINDDPEAAKNAIGIYDKYKDAAQKVDTDTQKTNLANQVVMGTARMLPGLIGTGLKNFAPIVGKLWSFSDWARQGAGDCYTDMVKSGVDHETARGLAAVAGSIYSAVEQLQFAQVSRIPGVKVTLSKIPGIGRIADGAIKNELIRLIAQKGKDWGKEVSEEGVQQIVTDAANEIGRQVAQTPDRQTDVGNAISYVANDAFDQLKAAAGPMAVLTLFGVGVGAAKNYAKRRLEGPQAPPPPPPPGTPPAGPAAPGAPPVPGYVPKAGTPTTQDILAGAISEEEAAKLQAGQEEGQPPAAAVPPGTPPAPPLEIVGMPVQEPATAAQTPAPPAPPVPAPAETITAQVAAIRANSSPSKEVDQADKAAEKIVALYEGTEEPKNDAEILDRVKALERGFDEDTGMNEKSRKGSKALATTTRDSLMEMPGRVIFVNALHTIKNTGRKAALAAIDLMNVGGINDFFLGKSADANGEMYGQAWAEKHPEFLAPSKKPIEGHEAANIVLAKVGSEIRNAIGTAGAQGYRTGGDELMAIDLNRSKDDLRAALATASDNILSYTAALGIHKLSHPKHSGMPTGGGTIDFGVIDVDPNENLWRAISDADLEAEEKKQNTLAAVSGELVAKNGKPLYIVKESFDSQNRRTEFKYVRNPEVSDVERDEVEKNWSGQAPGRRAVGVLGVEAGPGQPGGTAQAPGQNAPAVQQPSEPAAGRPAEPATGPAGEGAAAPAEQPAPAAGPTAPAVAAPGPAPKVAEPAKAPAAPTATKGAGRPTIEGKTVSYEGFPGIKFSVVPDKVAAGFVVTHDETGKVIGRGRTKESAVAGARDYLTKNGVPEAQKGQRPADYTRTLAIEKTYGLSPAEAAVVDIALDKIKTTKVNYSTAAEALQKEALRIAVPAKVAMDNIGGLALMKRVTDEYVPDWKPIAPKEEPAPPKAEPTKYRGTYEGPDAVVLEDFNDGSQKTLGFSADYDKKTGLVLLQGEWGDPETGAPREMTVEAAREIAKTNEFGEALTAAIDRIPPTVEEQPAPPAEAKKELTPEERRAEVRRRTLQKMGVAAEKMAGPTAEDLEAKKQGLITKREEVQSKRDEALAKLKENAEKFRKSLEGPTPGRLGTVGNEQIEIAIDMVGNLFDAGYRTFEDMLLAIQEIAADLAKNRIFQQAVEAAYDSYQETGEELPARGDTTAASVLGEPTAEAKIEQPEGVVPGTADLISAVVDKLKTGEAIDNPALTEMANEAFGGTRGEGKYTPRDSYDAVEAAANRFIESTLPVKFDDPTATIQVLIDATDLLPRQADRTREQVEFQQFSTPPAEAFVAVYAAGIRPGMSMLEPSAGTGNLAVMGRIAGAEVSTNEISPRRRGVLEILGFKPTDLNAEQLDNLLPEGTEYDVVVMNPPFSATGGRVERHDTAYGARHVEQALRRVKKGGRLVAIVGQGMAHDRPAFAEWWDKIEKKYNVRANIGISGKFYGKYGTGFDNQILVIDNTGPTPGENRADRIANVLRASDLAPDQAISVLQPIAEEDVNERISEATKPSGPAAATGVVPQEPGTEKRPGPRPSPASVGGRPGATQPAAGPGGRGGRGGISGVAATGPQQPAVPGQKPPTPGVGKPSEPLAAGAGTTGSGVGGGVGGAVARRSAATERGPVELEEAEGSPFTKYVVSKARYEDAQEHPADIVESATLASVEHPEATYQPSIPVEVLKDGRLSDIQMEAITYAGQRHEQRLASGPRAEYLIGDSTGVGKGREIAGIILDNWNKGRRKAVWISASHLLAVDAQRDVDDVTMPAELAQELKVLEKGALMHQLTAKEKDRLAELRKQRPIKLIEQADFKKENTIEAPDGVVFTAYSLISQDWGHEQTRFKQVADWLGKDFDGVIVFDECHAMKHAITSDRGGRATGKAGTNRGHMGVELKAMFPDARIVNVSATSATTPSNLGYLSRMGLWGPGAPFAEFSGFMNAVKNGGVGAMEMLSRDLKAIGAFVSRMISYRGKDQLHTVQYRTLFHGLTDAEKAMYDDAADLWAKIQKEFDEAAETVGKPKSAMRGAWSQFYSGQQRFFLQMLMSYQMDDMVKDAEKQLADGKSVVISLYNTNEIATMKKAAQILAEGGNLDDDLDMTPRQMLVDLVDKYFPVQEYQAVPDPLDPRKVIMEPVVDAAGNPVISRENERRKEELLDTIGKLNLPANPLDYIVNHFGPTKIAEITGREKRIEKGSPRPVRRRVPGVPADQVNEAEIKAFQNGDKKIAVISGAASTGISLHADERAKNKSRRVFYAMQLSWSADKQMQSFGRVHRSNQASAPEIILVQTDVAGQKRLINTTSKRLASLGAVAAGTREAYSGGLFEVEDITDDYGQGALLALYQEMKRNDLETLRRMSVLNENDDVKREIATNVENFLNRIMLLPVAKQNQVFERFYAKYLAAVEMAKANGTFDIGVEKINATNLELVGQPELVYTHPQSGAQTKIVTIAGDVKVKKVTINRAIESGLSHLKDKKRKPRFYKNDRGGTTYVAFESELNDPGLPEKVIYLYGPRGSRVPLNMDELYDRYTQLDEESARREWDDQYKDIPDTDRQRWTLITGAVFPIYDKVFHDTGIKTRVLRGRLDNGETYIGLQVDPQYLPKIRQNLGIGATLVDASPQDIFNMVMDGDAVIELDNGWRLSRVTVHGEERFEIRPTGAKIIDRKEMELIGAIEEKIEYKNRYFVPANDADGPVVLRKLLNMHRAIRDVTDKRSIAFSRPESRYAPRGEPIMADWGLDRMLALLPRGARERIKVHVVDGMTFNGVYYAFDEGRPGAAVPNPDDDVTDVYVWKGASIEQLAATFAHEIPGHIGSMMVFRANPEYRTRMLQFWNDYKKTDGYKSLQNRYGEDMVLLPENKKEEYLFREFVAGKLEDHLMKRGDSLAEKIYNFFRSMLVKMGVVEGNIDDLLREMVKAMRVSNENELMEAQEFAEDAGMVPAFSEEWTSADEQGFYSPTIRTIESEVRQEKGVVPQILSMIKGGKLKKAEVEWVGLEQYLKDNPQATKSDVLEYMREKRVSVRTVEKGEPAWVVYDDSEDQYFGTRKEAMAYAEEMGIPTDTKHVFLASDQARNVARFTSYNPFGSTFGENPREINLVMPPSTRRSVYEKTGKLEAYGEATKHDYRVPSAHAYGDEADVNRIAHMRTWDTQVGDDKTLAVGEMQSDWTREAREKGVQGTIPEQRTFRVDAGANGRWFVVDDANREWTNWPTRAEAEAEAVRMNVRQPAVGGAIPPMPFFKNWDELSTKKAILAAANEGYDRIAFVNGEQTAGLYDLSKVVDQILAERNADGTFNMGVKPVGSSERSAFQNTIGGKDLSNMTVKDVEETFGKDIAAKVSSGTGFRPTLDGSERVVYSGLDLKLGGEWAKALYDQRIPSILRDLIKKNKWNTEIEEVQLPGAVGGKNISLRIVPEMREQVQRRGLPMFQILGYQPGGAAFREAQVKSPQFKEWFGDSKVVDLNDNPMVVYHASLKGRRFNVFDTSMEGAHFGTEEQALGLRGEARGAPRPFYLSIQNPLRMPDLGTWNNFKSVFTELSRSKVFSSQEADAVWSAYQSDDVSGWTKLKAILGEKGYDGIYYPNEVEGEGYSFIAFYPNQIKSATGNTGAFSRTTPNIMFRRVEGETARAFGPEIPYFSKPKRKTRGEVAAEQQAKAEDLERTIRSLRARLNFRVTEDRLLERAQLEVQIRDFQLEKLESIRSAIYNYARAIGANGEPYNKVDTLLKNTRSAQDSVRKGVVIKSQLKKALETLDDLMQERTNRFLVGKLREKMSSIYEKMDVAARGPKALPWTVETSQALLEYLSQFQYAEPYRIQTDGTLVRADDTSEPGRRVMLKNLAEKGSKLNWVVYDADTGYILGRNKNRTDAIKDANEQIAKIGIEKLGDAYAAAPAENLILFVDNEVRKRNDDLIAAVERNMRDREAVQENENTKAADWVKANDEYLEALKVIEKKNIAEMENADIARAITEINEIVKTGRTENDARKAARAEERYRLARIAERDINKKSGYDPSAKSKAETTTKPNLFERTLNNMVSYGMDAMITPQTMFQWMTGEYTKVGKRPRNVLERYILEPFRKAYFQERDDFEETKATINGLFAPVLEDHKLAAQTFAVTAQFNKLKALTVEENAEYDELLRKPSAERTQEEQERFDELDDALRGAESVTQTNTYNLEEMMFIYANSRNSGNRGHLYGTGFTDDAIAEVERQLPDKAKAVVEALWDYYDTEQYPKINEVYRRMFNQDMPKVPYYFPIANILTPNAEYSIAADLIERYSARSGVQRGFTIKRVRSKAPFKKMELYTSIMDNAQKVTHFVHSAETVRDVNAFVNSGTKPSGGGTPVRFLREALQNRSKHYNVDAWLDDFVKRMAYGRAKNVGNSSVDKWFDYGRFAYTVYVLGLNLKTILKTPANVILASRYVSTPHLLWSAFQAYLPVPVKVKDETYTLPSGTEVTVKKGEIAPPWARAAQLYQFAASKSSMMKHRAASYDREIQEIKEKLTRQDVFGRLVKKSGIDKADAAWRWFADFSMSGIRIADILNSTVVWTAKYREVLNRTQDEGRAIRLADEAVEKAFPGGGLLYYTKFQMGTGVSRSFSMFTSDLVKIFSAFVEVVGDAPKQGLLKGSMEVLWMSVLAFALPGLWMYLVNTGFDPRRLKDDPEGLLGTIFSQLYGGFPLINQAMDMGVGYLANVSREHRFAPVQRLYSTSVGVPWISMLASLVPQIQSAWGDNAAAAEKMLRIVGVLSGLPLNVPLTVVKGIGDLAAGKETDLRRILWTSSQLRPASVESRVGRALAAGGSSKDYLRAMLVMSQMDQKQVDEVVKQMVEYKTKMLKRAIQRAQNKGKQAEKKLRMIERYTKP